MSGPRESLAAGTVSTTAASTTTIPRKRRVAGVDVARGLALIGMMAVHVLPAFDDADAPTATTLVAGGRSAATFVLVAGVGLAFLSGGPKVVQGRERTAAAAGLAVRAVLIGALGLVLGLLEEFAEIGGILPFYGLLFLLAIPLLGLAPLALACVAAAVVALGPVLLVATADAGLPYPDSGPTPAALVQDPLGLLVQLTMTGSYPLVVYLAYLCAGLAIGRLDLGSRRVAWWLLGVGAALAVMARVVSAIVLYPLGGLARLTAENDTGDGVQTLLWDPELSASWWFLALPGPHSHTSVDVTQMLGSAIAVLGAALLLTRIPAVARLLRPLAVAGSMALTLYSAHFVLLATGVLGERPVLLYLLMVTGACAFALLWHRLFGQGPLERIVAAAAGRTRRTAARLLATRPATTPTSPDDGRPASWAVIRGTKALLPFVTVAATLALAVWAGSRTVPSLDPPSEAASAASPSPAGGADPAAVFRYCMLSEQVHDLDALDHHQPGALDQEAALQLDEMTRVAPVQIHDAVSTVVEGARAGAGQPGSADADHAIFDRAEMTIDAFEESNCP